MVGGVASFVGDRFVDGGLGGFEVRAVEDPVDAAPGFGGGETGGGGFIGIGGGMGGAVGVDELTGFRADEDGVWFEGFGSIEIAGDDDGGVFAGDVLKFGADELGGFEASLFAFVIEVGIGEEDGGGVGGGLGFEFGPGDDAGEGGVPGFGAGLIGGFAEPEVTFVDKVEGVFAEHDGNEFAVVFAVVSAGAHEVVIGEFGL